MQESPYCLDWNIRSCSITIKARGEVRQEETLLLGQEMSWALSVLCLLPGSQPTRKTIQATLNHSSKVNA